jgi:hypothetical protein
MLVLEQIMAVHYNTTPQKRQTNKNINRKLSPINIVKFDDLQVIRPNIKSCKHSSRINKHNMVATS